MSEDHEIGLETLLAVRTELGVNLEDELLEACFEIQKKRQFDHDRTLSTQAMDRLIESYVENTAELTTKEGDLKA